jgi:hypothetical protein
VTVGATEIEFSAVTPIPLLTLIEVAPDTDQESVLTCPRMILCGSAANDRTAGGEGAQ